MFAEVNRLPASVLVSFEKGIIRTRVSAFVLNLQLTTLASVIFAVVTFASVIFAVVTAPAFSFADVTQHAANSNSEMKPSVEFDSSRC